MSVDDKNQTIEQQPPEKNPVAEETVKVDDDTNAADKHPDRTRFGDWEHNGRCIDF